MTTDFDRRAVKPVLVYWHCQCYWPLEDGPICEMEHDTPIYDDRPRRGRKRLVWICSNKVAFLSRDEFLEHDEAECYAE